MSEQACTWEKMFLAIGTVVNISQIIQTVVTLRCIKMSFTVLYAPNSFSNICNCLSSFLMFRSLAKMLWGQKLLLPCQVKTCGGNLPPLPPCFHHLWGLICYSMSSWSAKKQHNMYSAPIKRDFNFCCIFLSNVTCFRSL